tara:strand:- start:932 stop:1093 length:162 start_codon:yes stop_codon:yes gene_type:complete
MQVSVGHISMSVAYLQSVTLAEAREHFKKVDPKVVKVLYLQAKALKKSKGQSK